MKHSFILLYLITLLFLGCKDSLSTKKNNDLTAKEIMQRAHKKAGGSFWQKPKSLTLKGHAVFYKDSLISKHEIHNMWRIFNNTKEDAHIANGKVRIESFKNKTPVFIVTFDGKNTYDLNGKQNESNGDIRWASSFGYGAIRHAFDDGYKLQLMTEDTIKNKIAYTIKVIDINKGETFFGIDKENFTIVKVAFQTPRGWHHREYSEFFSKDKYSWLQSGRVELFYNDILSNEVYWDDFEVNEILSDNLFILK